MRVLKAGLICLFLLFILPHSANAQEIEVSPPEDFKAYRAAEQKTTVSVYQGGSYVCDSLVKIDGSFISFLETEKIAASLRSVADRAALAIFLSKPLTINSQKFCQWEEMSADAPRRQAICVSYNPDDFTADIHIPQSMLSRTDISGGVYLPEPNTGFSSILRASAALADESNNNPEYNLRLYHLAAYNENFLAVDASVGDKNTYIENFYAQRREESLLYTAGFFPVDKVKVVSQPELAGFAVNSSMETRVDLEQAYGNKIQVYLPYRSQVNIKKDGQLMSSKFCEAGNQILDTSNLPQGAYDITIEIVDMRGISREEKRFFVKSEAMPPMDTPYIWAGAGYIKKTPDKRAAFPQAGKDVLGFLGGAVRISNSAGISGTALVMDRKAIIENGIMVEAGRARLGANASLSSDNDGGISLYCQLYPGMFNMSFDLRKIWSADKCAENCDDYNPFGNDSFQTRLSGAYSFPKLAAGFDANITKYADAPSDYSYGPNVRWDMSANAGKSLRLESRLTFTRDETILSVNLSAALFYGKYLLGGSARREMSSDKNNTLYPANKADAYLTVKDDNFLDGEATAAAAYYYDDGNSARLSAGMKNNYGQFDASAYIQKGTTRNSVNINTALVQSGKHIAFGGKDGDLSAVILRVDADEPNDEFFVLLNSARWGKIKSEKNVPMFLSPHRQYKISVQHAGDNVVELEETAKRVALFPGNAQYLNWKARSSAIIIGRAVSPDGTPVANGYINTPISYDITGDNGSFQISAYIREGIELEKEDGSVCKMKIPAELKPKNSVIVAGKLVCQ